MSVIPRPCSPYIHVYTPSSSQYTNVKWLEKFVLIRAITARMIKRPQVTWFPKDPSGS